jgi:hypothetical protein
MFCTDLFAQFPAPMLDGGHLNDDISQQPFTTKQWILTSPTTCGDIYLMAFVPIVYQSIRASHSDVSLQAHKLPKILSVMGKYRLRRPHRTTTKSQLEPFVLGFLPEEPSTATCHIKPTRLLPNYNGVDTYSVNHGDPSYDWQRDPRAMRECLMLQADGKPLTETFRKSAKDVVASPNTRKASSARRKHAARFKCPIDGCNDDFTRKHNLDSE